MKVGELTPDHNLTMKAKYGTGIKLAIKLVDVEPHRTLEKSGKGSFMSSSEQGIKDQGHTLQQISTDDLNPG